MTKTYTLNDFGNTDRRVNALWLMEELTPLRQWVYKNNERVYHSSFSKWRKMAGTTGTELLTQREALTIVFLAVYSKLGKPMFGLKLVQLEPEDVKIGGYVRTWLVAIQSRITAQCPTGDDAMVCALLDQILVNMPTVEQYSQQRDKVLKDGSGVGTLVSIRTLQRRAKGLGIRFSLKEPIPTVLLKEMFH